MAYIDNHETASDYQSAAFIAGAYPNRNVKVWDFWGFKKKNDLWMSIINGYTIENGNFYYNNDNYVNGETFNLAIGYFTKWKY